MQTLKQISLVVKDYDEALAFYLGKLDFELVEDTELPEQNKRWIVIKPKGSTGINLLLAKASSEAQASRIGNQTGGRVFLFLETDDFWNDYRKYINAGVEFVREAQTHDYGTVAVFKDLYGNLFDLIQTNAN
ncbi:MAG: VOC family protein [Pseudohongiellaceae bacterium]